MMRIISGGKWTKDGRWIVVNDKDEIVYDPDNAGGRLYPDPLGSGKLIPDFNLIWLDLKDCRGWVKQNA